LILSPKRSLFSLLILGKKNQISFSGFFQGYYLIIGEDFKNSFYPRMEILDSAKDKDPLCGRNDNLIALVCYKSIDSFVPVFSFGKIELLANLIEKQIAISRKE
jgi:hypothetical protein